MHLLVFRGCRAILRAVCVLTLGRRIILGTLLQAHTQLFFSHLSILLRLLNVVVSEGGLARFGARIRLRLVRRLVHTLAATAHVH